MAGCGAVSWSSSSRPSVSRGSCSSSRPGAPLRAELLEIGRLLVAGDRSGVRDHLRAFGPWAPVVSAALILGQAVVAPLPSFPLIYANGLLFGTLWGGLLSWASVLASAALCFGLARLGGRPLVERVASPAALRRTDALFERYGVFAVLLARLMPVTAFDLLSYAAGLTRMRLVPFLRRDGDRHDPGDLSHGRRGRPREPGAPGRSSPGRSDSGCWPRSRSGSARRSGRAPPSRPRGPTRNPERRTAARQARPK